MSKKNIWANCIVNNEENFIWFAIMSVVDYVDKVLVYDTGSTDNTVKIIQEIIKKKGEKIKLKEVGKVNKYEFTKMRQKMLEQSMCDWILILDGDEVWWENSIKKLIQEINKKGEEIGSIAVPMIVPIGDMYHFQDKSAGRYEILGHKGHISLRAINKKIPGLHIDFPYGKEGYIDGKNVLVQERGDIVFIEAPYFHLTHLKRSGKPRIYNKFKLEVGNKFTPSFKYPEVFNKSYPAIISNPWQKLSILQSVLAAVITPLRQIKRKFQ